jgi:hypothetical protein
MSDLVTLQVGGMSIEVSADALLVRAKLSKPQQEFCDLVSFEGMNAKAAYLEAFGTVAENDAPSRLMRHQGCAMVIREQRIAAQATLVMDGIGRRSFLKRATEVNVTDIYDEETGEIRPEYGDLIESFKINDHPEKGRTVEIKLVSRLKSIELDAKLSGDTGKEEVNLLALILNQAGTEKPVDGPVIDIEEIVE